LSPEARPVHEVTWPDWDSLQLSEWQYDLLADRSKKKIVDAGRGAGKSYGIVLDAMIDAVDLYDERVKLKNFPRPGPLVVVAFVAPNMQNLRDLWGAVKALAPKLKGNTKDGEKRYLVRNNEKVMYLFGESRGIDIRILSAWLPNSMRGMSIDILVCDEWAFCGYSVERQKTLEGSGKGGDEVYFTILQKLINRAFCHGKVTIASTPLSNYFDDWCQAAAAGGDGHAFSGWSFHQAKWSDNQFLTPQQVEDIEAERRQNEYKFRQEREGELHVVFPKFTATDRAFTTELIDSVLIAKLAFMSKGPYGLGIDVSWMGPDWLCVGVADLSLNVLVHVELHPKTALPDILQITQRLMSKFKVPPGRFGYDATGEGKSLSKLFPQEWEAEAVYFWDKQKPHLVKGVELRLQHGGLRIPDPEHFDFSTLPHCKMPEDQDQRTNFAQLVAELRDYRRREDTLANGEKRVKYMKGDLLKRDDCVDMLSVLNHVMPSLALQVKSGKTKQKLADAFNKQWGGGDRPTRRAA
jgi:hypothetical protein